MWTRIATLTLTVCLLFSRALSGQEPDLFDRVKDGYAVSDGGVKIHYATLGTGPLVVISGTRGDTRWRRSPTRFRSSLSTSAGTT
jgi:hypothetical protein